ncbi:MAG TPA: LamG domain-containing protein [Nannocystaceae bacterium]|nr:LamG domain-containing protein [Nannocystaceae bacterium]
MLAQVRWCGALVVAAGCFTDVDPGASAGTSATSGAATTAGMTSTGDASSSGSTADASSGGSTASTSGGATTGEVSTSTGAASSTSGSSSGGPPQDLGAPADACPEAAELVACYAFEEGWLDDALVDSVGAHSGSMTGATSVTGVRGSAAGTDATALISVPGSSGLAGTPPFTLMAWLRVDVMPEARSGVIDRDYDYGIFVKSTGEVLCSTMTTAPVISPGAWTHVAYVRTEKDHAVYVDGVLSVSGVWGGSQPGVDNAVVLANNSPPTPAEALVGAIDEVMLWRKALSNAEICAVAGIVCD